MQWFINLSILLFIASIVYIIIRFIVDTKLSGAVNKIISERERKFGFFEKVSSVISKLSTTEVNKEWKFSTWYKNKFSGNTRLIINIAFFILTIWVLIYVFAVFATMLYQGQINSFEEMFVRSDAPHYLQLAKDWYNGSPETAKYIVFYPLYPILIKIFSFIALGNYFIAAEIVSILSLIFACFFLYKLVEEVFGAKLAYNAVKYMLIFPVSFFLIAPFTESIFLLLSILTFYLIHREKWILAAVIGLLAGLTRFHGILLVIPFIIEFLIKNNVFPNLLSREKSKIKQAFSDIRKKGLIGLIIPCGYLLYLGLNYIVTGNSFSYIFWQEEEWAQKFSIFYEGGVKSISKNIGIITSSDPHTIVGIASGYLVQFVILCVAFLLIVYAIKIKFNVSYFSYFVIYLFGTISLSHLLSTPRYVLEIFPVFILLSMLSKNRKVDTVITIASSLMLMYCIFVYVNKLFIF